MAIRAVGIAALRSPRLIAVTSRRRKKLLFCFALCFLQSLYVWFLVGELDSMWMVEDFPSQRPINWTLEEADAKSYLEALVRGNAEIAAVVEKPKLPEIRLGCSEVLNVSIREPGDWLEVDRWSLFGAHEDRRSNSLYPQLGVSVQLIASTFHTVDESRERWFCHLWNGELRRVAAHFRLIWQRAWDPRLTFQNPYLITCAVPNDFPLSEGAAVTIRGRRCPPSGSPFLRIRQIAEAQREAEKDQRKLSENQWLSESQRLWDQNAEMTALLTENEENLIELGQNRQIDEKSAEENQRQKRNALIGQWAQPKTTTKIPTERKADQIEENPNIQIPPKYSKIEEKKKKEERTEQGIRNPSESEAREPTTKNSDEKAEIQNSDFQPNPQKPPKTTESNPAPPNPQNQIPNAEYLANQLIGNHYAEFSANENPKSPKKQQNHQSGNPKTATPLPRVAVCVKGLDFFEDRSRPLVEWTLLQFALGAHSVTIYVYYIPSKTRRILEAIAADFPLRIQNLTLPGRGVNNEPKARHDYIWNDVAQKRRNELIPYNDCFYRHAPAYDYVLLVDTDEVVVPRQHPNWSQMIADFTRNFRSNATSLSVRNVFKFGDEDSLLERRRRSKRVQPPGVSGKSFMSTKTAATVFNHFALHRLHGDTVRTAYFPPKTALKLHFKSDCPIDARKECKQLRAQTIADHSLDRWRQPILQKASTYLRLQ